MMNPDNTLEATWFILDREPGMDDLAEGLTDVLKKMSEDLEIFPFQDRDKKDHLFLARFELPKYGEVFQHPEALEVFKDKPEDPAGFIDFLSGFPVDCIEMLVAIGEYSSQAKEGETSKVTVKAGDGKAAAPVPEKFFDWPEKSKVLFNLTALPTKDVAKIMAKNLDGEDKPKKVHWWFRSVLSGKDAEEQPVKWPVPGEFLGLGVRMMPDKPWGKQKSSPFVYAGNWMDTVYYSSAVIKEIQEPTDDTPYSTYTVTWRGQEIIGVRPSDFAEYKVGDRVTIIKDVATEKKTQLWKDDDLKEFDTEKWMIAPIAFYGLEQEV